MSEPVAELRVRLQPRASANEIAGVREGALIVRVTAPPEDGKANAALCKVIAGRLRMGITRVEVVRGHSSREKVLRVRGVTEQRLRDVLGL